MKYLTRPVRIGIMSFLILCFFILAPLTLFYTAGYRYDFEQKQVKQTGVLNIDAKPQNLKVFLNDIEQNKKVPIYLPNRAPGTYKIKLSLDGYKTWEKDITIESKKTTYIKNVTLFKESNPVEILAELKNNIVDIYPSISGEYALILSKNNEDITEINLYNFTTKKINPIFRNKTKGDLQIDWSDTADYAAIITTEDKNKRIQLVDPKTAEVNPGQEFSTGSTWYWIKNQSTPSLYVKDGENLLILNNVGTQKMADVSSTVWYADGEIDWKFDEKNLCLKHIFGDTKENCSFGFKEKITKLISANSNRLIYQNAHGITAAILENGLIKEEKTVEAENYLYNQFTDEWLLWSAWELWTIYPNGAIALLNRTGDQIKSVKPLDNFGLLLLASENKITGFNPGYYVTHELSNNIKIKKIGADTTNRKIYFLGTSNDNNGLFELDY